MLGVLVERLVDLAARARDRLRDDRPDHLDSRPVFAGALLDFAFLQMTRLRSMAVAL